MGTGGWILIVLAVVVAGWLIFVFNRLVALRNQVQNAWAQIDVQLKRRHDLIPNLVEVVKDAMGYEQDTLRQVVEARSAALAAHGPREAAPAEAALSAALGRLMVVMENYPQLRANENVQALQEELTTTENRIAFARQFYNDSVMGLNNMVQSFPANMVAGSFGFAVQAPFDVPESERAPVKVDLR